MNPLVAKVAEEVFDFALALLKNKLTSAADRAAALDLIALRASNQAKLDARRAKR